MASIGCKNEVFKYYQSWPISYLLKGKATKRHFSLIFISQTELKTLTKFLNSKEFSSVFI